MAYQVFCKICGNKIWSTATSCPYCDDDPTDDKTIKMHCGMGHIVSSSAKYCPQCGEKEPASSSGFAVFMLTLLAISIIIMLVKDATVRDFVFYVIKMVFEEIFYRILQIIGLS
jgi:hypothetical protein